MYQICFRLHSGLCVYEEGMSWFLFWEGPSVVGDVNHTNRSLQPVWAVQRCFMQGARGARWPFHSH